MVGRSIACSAVCLCVCVSDWLLGCLSLCSMLRLSVCLLFPYFARLFVFCLLVCVLGRSVDSSVGWQVVCMFFVSRCWFVRVSAGVCC